MLKFSQLSLARKLVLMLVISLLIGATVWVWPSLLFAKTHWPITLLFVVYVGFRVFAQYHKSKTQHQLHVQSIMEALQDGPKTMMQLVRVLDVPDAYAIVEAILEGFADDVQQVSQSPVRYQWRGRCF